MNFLRNLKIGAKTVGVVVLVLVVMGAATGFGLLQTRRVGAELAGIAELDLPLADALNRVAQRALEQSYARARAERLGERLAESAAMQRSFDAAEQTWTASRATLETALQSAESLAQNALAGAGISADLRSELTAVSEQLRAIADQRVAQDRQTAEMFGLFRQGQLAAAAELAEKSAEAAEKIDHDIEALSEKVATFTEVAAKNAEAHEHAAIQISVVISAVATILGLACAMWLGRSLTRALREAVGLLERVAKGDLTVKITPRSGDESGQIIIAANAMVDDLRRTVGSLGATSHGLSASAEELSAVSAQMSSGAEETSSQATVVASAAEQVSKNIGTVAASAEEMTATIKEISQRAAEAAQVAAQAAQTAERADGTINQLGDSSGEIGKVINVITSIAEQTNLLALNATIEAARAGEAGKGFAVVANEVKELAKQTARATDEIRAKIEAIQTDAKGAVTAIREISEVIHRINEIQTAIASSVEEQAATMNEISNNSTEAARGGSEIAQNITSVSQAAKSSTEAASHTASSATELSRLAHEVHAIIQRFRLESDGAPAAAAAIDPETRPLVPLHTPAPSAGGEAGAKNAPASAAKHWHPAQIPKRS